MHLSLCDTPVAERSCESKPRHQDTPSQRIDVVHDAGTADGSTMAVGCHTSQSLEGRNPPGCVHNAKPVAAAAVLLTPACQLDYAG